MDDNELMIEHVSRSPRFGGSGTEIWIVRVCEKADHCGFRSQLIQQLNVLCCHLANQETNTRNVAPRSGEAIHNSELDRVTAHSKDQRDCAGDYRLSRNGGGGAAGRNNNVHLASNQIGSQRLQLIMMTLC